MIGLTPPRPPADHGRRRGQQPRACSRVRPPNAAGRPAPPRALRIPTVTLPLCHAPAPPGAPRAMLAGLTVRRGISSDG